MSERTSQQTRQITIPPSGGENRIITVGTSTNIDKAIFVPNIFTLGRKYACMCAVCFSTMSAVHMGWCELVCDGDRISRHFVYRFRCYTQLTPIQAERISFQRLEFECGAQNGILRVWDPVPGLLSPLNPNPTSTNSKH